MRTKREVVDKLTALRADERISYPPANVMINAPLALIQTDLEAKIETLEWLLDEPNWVIVQSTTPLVAVGHKKDPRVVCLFSCHVATHVAKRLKLSTQHQLVTKNTYTKRHKDEYKTEPTYLAITSLAHWTRL